MFPLTTSHTSTTSSPSTSEVDVLPPKLYKKPMNAEWAHRYNTNHEEREARKATEEQRRQQDLPYGRQVRFCCWMKDGEDPEFVRLQGITTFPKLNMADHPKLLKTLGLTKDDDIWLYDPDGRSFAREDVDHVMEVTAHQVILTRLYGVKNCPRLDEYIALYCNKRPVAGSSRRTLPSTALKRKAAFDGLGAFPPSLKTPHPAAFSRPSTPPSPNSSSPSPTFTSRRYHSSSSSSPSSVATVRF
ncbi:hypothetical protein MVEN_02309300 [Mycena venus]|uniref:Uncharacterized protein n=1 Tax=Mycena venus TaxID=2733690 RepID=A0A8H6X400_9AGAR|nr:hypothetical protein MVEN_02309300 [Mycena venus]